MFALLLLGRSWNQAELVAQRRGGIMPADTGSGILRLKAVLDRTGLSRSTFSRKIDHGTFPKQVRMSERCIDWRGAEIERWVRYPLSQWESGLDILGPGVSMDPRIH